MKWCLLSLYTDFLWEDTYPVGFCTQYTAPTMSTLLRSTECHITCCWCWGPLWTQILWLNLIWTTSVHQSVLLFLFFQPQRSISNTSRFHNYHRHLRKLLLVITKYFGLLLSCIPYYERHYFWSNLHVWRDAEILWSGKPVQCRLINFYLFISIDISVNLLRIILPQ